VPDDNFFGSLLRGHRHAAGLSIDELAGASGLSVRAIGDMERGRSRRPQARTVVLLADALGLNEDQRAALTRSISGAPGSADLPAVTTDFVGRTPELARLAQLGAGPEAAVIVLAGAAGFGKTTLAAHSARQQSDHFPDGVLFVNLRGMDPVPLDSTLALARLLRALGVPERDIPDDESARAALYRSTLQDKRVLIVLDNAADERQVRPLVPGVGASVTLITSRRVLAGLETVHRLHLDTMSGSESVELLQAMLGGRPADEDALADVAELCGRLPLALRIAGRRLLSRPDWDVRQLADRLADQQQRLQHLSAGDLQVATAFQLSYRQLSAAAARTFRRLTLTPGPDAGLELATVLSGLPVGEAEESLDELVDLGLLQSSATLRFSFHDLVRLFGRRQLDEEETGIDQLRDRMVAWLLTSATTAGGWFQTQPVGAREDAEQSLSFDNVDEAQAWLQAEGDNWLGAMRLAAEAGANKEVAATAEAMHWFSERWPYWGHWEEVFGLGRQAAAATGDRVMEATQLNYLAWVAASIRLRPDLALEYTSSALEIAEQAGDLTQQAWSLFYLSSLYAAEQRHEASIGAGERAVRLFGTLGDNEGLATALTQVMSSLLRLGRPAEALDSGTRGLAILDDPANGLHPQVATMMRMQALRLTGIALSALGRRDEAIAVMRESVTLSEPMGAGLLSNASFDLGRMLYDAGQQEQGVELMRRSIAMRTEAGDEVWAARTQKLLDAILAGQNAD